ncbi:hypothetical protein OAU85_00520 [Candidatus Poseidoniaceae archaeon]|nr:hypothetical protein [Candidatus Poseidoniaceae archaeon]
MSPESPPTPLGAKSSQRPASIVLNEPTAPIGLLEGETSFPSSQPYLDPSFVKQPDSWGKSMLMFVLGVFLPVALLILIQVIGISIEDSQREREEQEHEEYVEDGQEFPDPYEMTFVRNETGEYSTTIDLPDTHELSQCYIDLNGEPGNRYSLEPIFNEYLPESIICSTSNPASYDRTGGELLVWQLLQDATVAGEQTTLIGAEYSFQDKNLSLLFDNNFSENLTLDAFFVNDEGQYAKLSTQGVTLDGLNYTFDIQTNSTEEFYMEMSLNDSSYFFSAEACDSCPGEEFAFLDRAQFYRTEKWVVIGAYDAELNRLSFEPLPMVDGSDFPNQLEFDIGIDWAPISIDNGTVWTESYLSEYNPTIEFTSSANGTYSTQILISSNAGPWSVLECQVDSYEWPAYYDRNQRYPIYCIDDDLEEGYDALIYQESAFEIDEHVSLEHQSWNPETREFHVEFNRTLHVRTDDFSAIELSSAPFTERPDSVGERTNFTVTFEESDGGGEWVRFQMDFQIVNSTPLRAGGHSFSWLVCDDCDGNLSEPIYDGISTHTEAIGGYNLSNQTMWFQPLEPIPPTVEMSVNLMPDSSLQYSGYFDYEVYLYGDEYIEYQQEYYYDDYYDDYSNPADDFYTFAFIAYPISYIGAIIYSFVRGNKAFGKGLIASGIIGLALVGVLVVSVVLYFF